MQRQRKLPESLRMTKINEEPMDKHRKFIRFAKELGIEIDGVEPAIRDGKGTGVVASRPLKKGDILVKAPAKALINANTNFIKDSKIRDGTVHGLIAAELTVIRQNPGQRRVIAPWQAVWPSIEDLAVTMPILWSSEYQSLLPKPARAYLKKQQARMERDWKTSLVTLPESAYSQFQHFWLIVNTRCFHWGFNRWPPKRRSKRRKPGAKLPVDDQMTLCPFADYFNHSCSSNATFVGTDGACMVWADVDIDKGEEVLFTYGSYDNDYLMVEYGFILRETEHDSVILDEGILPRLGDAQKAFLEANNFYGNFSLSNSGICFRTRVAINVLVCGDDFDKVKRVISGQGKGAEEDEVHQWTVWICDDCRSRAHEAVAKLGDMDKSQQKDILLLRYAQMIGLFTTAIDFAEEATSRSLLAKEA